MIHEVIVQVYNTNIRPIKIKVLRANSAGISSIKHQLLSNFYGSSGQTGSELGKRIASLEGSINLQMHIK